jgi:Helix-turn-helix domain
MQHIIENTYRNFIDMGTERLLNHYAAAAALGIAPSTLALWRRTGKGPTVYKIGHRVMYDPTDITAWIEAQRQAPGLDSAKRRQTQLFQDGERERPSDTGGEGTL